MSESKTSDEEYKAYKVLLEAANRCTIDDIRQLLDDFKENLTYISPGKRSIVVFFYSSFRFSPETADEFLTWFLLENGITKNIVDMDNEDLLREYHNIYCRIYVAKTASGVRFAVIE